MLVTAKAGNLEAMFETAVAYHNGSGVPRDFIQSTYWSQKAAERGHPVAISMLIRAYRVGEGGPPNLAGAVRWELVAAQNGNVIAMGDLVRAYRRGEGVPRNNVEADKWLKQYAAAAPGSPDPAGPPEALERYWRGEATRAAGDASAAARDGKEAVSRQPSH
ncbi:tetratricopeptide repeat protein [Phenylobacterium sp.]|uniref:tetratricopeptide repeat protein n=1 Tax=Phenylobacterium sp. TaxID=1871053 RepID=UPI00374D4291